MEPRSGGTCVSRGRKPAVTGMQSIWSRGAALFVLAVGVSPRLRQGSIWSRGAAALALAAGVSPRLEIQKDSEPRSGGTSRGQLERVEHAFRRALDAIFLNCALAPEVWAADQAHLHR